jgi:hypothetical protein
MVIKQISIFLQNKLGRFSEVATLLGASGINMQAFTVAENAEFGIVRLIVDNTDHALEVLRAHSFAANVTDVLLIDMPDVPGSLANYMERLTEAGLFIEYMYAFSQNGTARVIIKTNDMARARQVFE